MEIVLILMVMVFGGAMAYFFKQSHYLTEQMIVRTDVATNDYVKELVQENLQTQEELKHLSSKVEGFVEQMGEYNKDYEQVKKDYTNLHTKVTNQLVFIQEALKENTNNSKKVTQDNSQIREHLRAIEKALKSHEALILNVTKQNVGQTHHQFIKQ